MKKITYIADPEILAIPIEECHEPMIDLKQLQTLAYGPPPETELTKNDYTKLRQTVYEKLCQAQQDLPQGIHFRLYEGYRSLKVQTLLFDWEYQRIKQLNPEFSKEQCFHEATRLVSPVKQLNGTDNIPPHNTGAAVDIELIDEEGMLLDMGMQCKDWLNVPASLCASDCQEISEKAKQNRRLLLEVMQAHGFVNYPTEWWHYSYRDRYWAHHQGKAHAIYGPMLA